MFVTIQSLSVVVARIIAHTLDNHELLKPKLVDRIWKDLIAIASTAV